MFETRRYSSVFVSISCQKASFMLKMCTLCLNLSLKQQQMPCTLFPTCNMLSGGSLRQWGWIQRPTTKQLRGPTFLTFICKCKQPQWEWLMDSVKEEMEDWTKSLWSLQPHTFFCPQKLPLLLLPTIPRVPPPSRRCSKLFLLYLPPAGPSESQTCSATL